MVPFALMTAHRGALLPSTWSELRLVTLVVRLTFMGALPVATCKSSAVEPVAVEGLETCRAGPPPTVPVSLVIAVAVLFREPRMKLPPLARMLQRSLPRRVHRIQRIE